MTLDLDRLAGDYAVVSELKLYQTWPFLDQGDFLFGSALRGFTSEVRLSVTGANPFRNRTRIAYSLPHAQNASVRVFDIQGRVVSELASGRHASGEYTVHWNGTDTKSRRVAAGTYFVELKTESSGSTRKLVYAP